MPDYPISPKAQRLLVQIAACEKVSPQGFDFNYTDDTKRQMDTLMDTIDELDIVGYLAHREGHEGYFVSERGKRYLVEKGLV